MLGGCPVAPSAAQSRWKRLALCLAACTGQPPSSRRTRTPWADRATPDSKGLFWGWGALTPAAWLRGGEASGQAWRNVLVEPQTRTQTRPPTGVIQTPCSEAPLLAAINRVRLAKRKTSPLLPPSVKVTPSGCQAGSEGWGHSQPAASLELGGADEGASGPQKAMGPSS